MDNDTIEGEVFEVTPEEDKPDRIGLFIHYLYEGKNIRQAAINAGYSETHASSNIYRDIKTKAVQDRIRDYATANDVLALPRICRIEENVLKHLETTPLDISKFRHTITQKKQIAGILRPDHTEVRPITINIGQIQAVLRADLTRKLGDIEPEAA